MQESVETIKAEFEERLRFEELLSNISSRFVNIPPDRVDPEINRALKEVLEFFQVDRCSLIQTMLGKGAWQITHLAAVEGVPPVPVGVDLPISMFPWVFKKLTQKREILSFSRLDELPPEASVDKQTWIGWSVRSNLHIPILIGEPVDRFIC